MKNEGLKSKRFSIPIIALIIISVLLIFSNIQLSSIFNNSSNDNSEKKANGTTASNAENSIAGDDEAEKGLEIEVEGIKLDFHEVREFLSIRLDEFIDIYGEPSKQELIYNDYFEDNTATLYYNFCEAMFIPINNQKGKLRLSNITIKTNDIVGPYNITVGDDIDTIFSMLPRTKYEGGRPTGIAKEAFGPNIEVIYLSVDGRDFGFIHYNASGEVSVVEYAQNYETGGATRLKLDVIQGKVSEMQIWQGYM